MKLTYKGSNANIISDRCFYKLCTLFIKHQKNTPWIKHGQTNSDGSVEISSHWQTFQSWVPLAWSNRCSRECLSRNVAGTQDAAVWPCGETTLLWLSQSSWATWTSCSQRWSSGQSEGSNGPSHYCRNTPDNFTSCQRQHRNYISNVQLCKIWRYNTGIKLTTYIHSINSSAASIFLCWIWIWPKP